MTYWAVGIKWEGEETYTIYDVYLSRNAARRCKKSYKLDGEVVKIFKLVEAR